MSLAESVQNPAIDEAAEEDVDVLRAFLAFFSDFKRNAAKWRCPSGECEPKSVWVKAERRYLGPLRVRGLAKVALHTDLTMLARLTQALARSRVVPLAA